MNVLYYGVLFSHDKGAFCTRKKFPYYLISCFATDFLYERNGSMYAGNAGDILIMEPGEIIYHGPKDKDTSFVNDWINLSGEDFRNLLHDFPLPLNEPFHIPDPNLVRNCIEAVSDELLLKHTGYEKKIDCFIIQMMIDLHRLYERTHDTKNHFRLETAREIFLRHPEKEWSLKEMAETCGYSVSRFSSLYTEQFGCSPKADLIRTRIERAKQMLHYGNHSITEIAELCGFHSIYYFSRYFKEWTGYTPSEYTKKHIQLIEKGQT